MELYTERVIQFIFSQYPSFDEYSTVPWNIACRTLKNIQVMYVRRGLYDSTGHNRMFSCVMDARSAVTNIKRNDACGHGYLYTFTLGCPTEEINQIKQIDSAFSELISCLAYGVSSTHFRHDDTDPVLTTIRKYRCYLPLRSIKANLLFGVNLGMLESKIKLEFEVHHRFGANHQHMRENLNLCTGLSRQRFERFCLDYIHRNTHFQLPQNHPWACNEFVSFELDRGMGDAKFPSTLVLNMIGNRLPNQETCRQTVASVISSYQRKENRLTQGSASDIILFSNALFLVAPVHIQAKYVAVDVDCKPNSFCSLSKSMLERFLGCSLPIPGAYSSLKTQSIRFLIQSIGLDNQHNRQFIGVNNGRQLKRQEMLLLLFLHEYHPVTMNML
jgi:hypothetical protein